MTRVQIKISSDGLAATATAAAGAAATTNDVLASLREAGVTHGIDTDAVSAFAERLVDPAFAGSALLARGTAATTGVDGHIEDLDSQQPIAGLERDDGSVDFRERLFLRTFPVDTQLARVVQPTPGQEGRDVRDRALPSKPGKPHKVRLGSGVRVDGDFVVAARAGSKLRDERLLDVVPLYSHAGDIDYASGNLHMEGSLAVRGDVQEGFAATATGDVHIGGAVLGASVEAGNIARIDQGVLGTNAHVRAGGDLLCRHATSALLEAGRGVVIGDQAAHCRIRAATLTAKTGRGAIVGGEARVEEFIKVRVAGTPNSAPTHLSVADVDADSVELEPVAAGPNAHDAAAPPVARTAVAIARAKELRRRERMRELMKTAVIEVADTLYAGVTITIGDVTTTIDQPRQHVRLRWVEATNTIAEEPMA